MRILHLSNTSIWPPMDGAGLRTCQLLRRVATRHEVHALQLCAPERAADDRATPAHVDADWLEQACSRLWSVSKDPAEVRVLFGFLHDAAAIRTGLKGALDRDYDVVWGHSADWAYFLPRHLLGRTLLDVQDCYDLSYRRQAKAASLRRRAKLAVKRRLYRYYARKYMSAVNTLVMVNQADADSVARILPGAKVEVVANGVDTRYYAPPGDWSRRPDAPTLVFTGVMSARQNVDAVRFFARRVLPLIRESVPGCCFQIVGRSPGKRVRELEDPRAGVQVVGGVPDIRPYLWDATLYVAPMISGTGIKNKILEAWAAGCAVVSTGLGGEALRARHDENILLADSPREMARQVARAMQDPALRSRLGRRGRETARQHYNWETHASHFERLLFEAANGLDGRRRTA